jgi:uncharacterized protein YbaR (Trm112 family)
MSLKVTIETKLKPLPKLTTLLPPFCGFMIDDIVTCNICLEDNDGNIEVDGCISGRGKRRLITACGHIFHKTCLQQWTSTCNKGSLCGLITCPYCRGPVYMDEESTETKEKLFAALASCECCPRHQSDRPLTYEHDPELDARTMSKEQEIALNTLETDDYIEWRNADWERRNDHLFQCDCHCRTRMRSMVRRIPPPSVYDWHGK